MHVQPSRRSRRAPSLRGPLARARRRAPRRRALDLFRALSRDLARALSLRQLRRRPRERLGGRRLALLWLRRWLGQIDVLHPSLIHLGLGLRLLAAGRRHRCTCSSCRARAAVGKEQPQRERVAAGDTRAAERRALVVEGRLAERGGDRERQLGRAHAGDGLHLCLDLRHRLARRRRDRERHSVQRLQRRRHLHCHLKGRRRSRLRLRHCRLRRCRCRSRSRRLFFRPETDSLLLLPHPLRLRRRLGFGLLARLVLQA
mmetsp:Transcript_14203/g.47022  ORF Transcript_14203/g.47022 Transcript_14203/m.47022 type:complete len:258 (-) Transcript_14203:71-844(-)